jgi:hypothetical protein
VLKRSVAIDLTEIKSAALIPIVLSNDIAYMDEESMTNARIKLITIAAVNAVFLL